MSTSSPDAAAAASTDAQVIQFPRRPWWASAPNPECVDWCELEHDPKEFASDAAMVCRRTIVDDHRFVVRAEYLVHVHDDELGEESPGAFVEIRLNELDVADAAELVAAIQEASTICDRAARAV